MLEGRCHCSHEVRNANPRFEIDVIFFLTQAGDIFSELDEVTRLTSGDGNLQIEEIRDKLQSARGDGFTSSQLEIFLGILATLVQMLILKILMLGQ